MRVTGMWLLSTLAVAGVAAGASPADTLRERDRRIREALAQGAPTSGERLRDLVSGSFDYQEHTRESFGRYWGGLTAAEREEALRLLAVLLERSSLDKIHEYRSEKVQYLSERLDPADPTTATVATRVTRGRETWEIGYRLRLREGRWRIVDVIVEGASTVESNRASFYREIRASGPGGLLAKLRKKAEGIRP